MKYRINDKVVHPYHGAGVISDICMKDISGEMVECVVISLSGGRAGILLPADAVEESGLRRVSSDGDIDEAMDILSQEGKELPKDWRRRIDVLKERVNSGDPVTIATAIRDVLGRSSFSKMNPSEKRVLNEAITVFAGELSLVRGVKLESARRLINKKVMSRGKNRDKKKA
ncbi:MAG TPA: CarD family transcriptional regulator [Candidatus Sabulitectum sp.]|nr:CarD family transcriptional regulator [Candidatus Sabulitectum sp.]HPF31757.1 CarD family transcriptional regulator [Candidatus Sabulitectum sp.]HPJ27777.1 CarD family transcriptional regulator [Candidatus Sabulitectum sp.]HPR21679.1 CarD family transcriptional regulator [Candidatus Sabulitectum sp.]